MQCKAQQLRVSLTVTVTGRSTVAQPGWGAEVHHHAIIAAGSESTERHGFAGWLMTWLDCGIDVDASVAQC